MASWKVSAPASVTAKTKTEALRVARAGLMVSKIPAGPAFLNGLTEQWSDDCSSPMPVETSKWDVYAMQRKDGIQSSSTRLSDIAQGRFQQSPTGGPQNKPYYHFHAPQGDNIWTPGTVGRSELGYPKGDPGNAPAHLGPPGAFFLYEGRRHIILFSVRLPSPWDVDAPAWRVIHQWKQNEWVDTGGVSPALALEQRRGNWIITQLGKDVIWSTPASTETWISFALDITFSQSNGKLKVWADKDQDGVYEYESGTYTGQTLFSKAGKPVESAWIGGLYEGVGGDSIDKAAHFIYG